MSTCDREKYAFLTEEELENCYEDELSPTQIGKSNERAKGKIDRVLNANILERNKAPQPSDIQSTVNIVLLGKTGCGKSATSNMLCGDHVFKSSDGAASCTTTTKSHAMIHKGTRFRIVDTPGLFDTKRKLKDVKHEAAKCVDLCDEGVHAFLYVYSAMTRRFSPEELATLRETKEMFGPEVVNFAGVILTHTDSAFKGGKTINDYIENSVKNTELEPFIKKDVNYRIVGINNAADNQYEKEFFKNALFDLIYKILDNTQQRAYSNKDMDTAKRMNLEMEVKRQAELKENQEKQTNLFYRACDSMGLIVQRRSAEYFSNMSLQQLETKLSNAEEEIRKRVKHDHPDECKQIGENIFNEIVQNFVKKSADSAREKLEEKQMEEAARRVEENKRAEAQKKEADAYEAKLAEMKQKEREAIKESEKEMSDKVWEQIRKYVEDSTIDQLGHPTDKDYDKVTQKVLDAFSAETRSRKGWTDVRHEVLTQVTVKKEAITKLAHEIHGSCFPCGSKVITHHRGPILIEQLQLGDEVLTLHQGTLNYESVIFFSHAEPDIVLPYITLNVGNDHILTMSPEHMVHVGSVGNLKQASEVREGDVLIVLEDEELTPRQVTSVSAEWRSGAYCPHTTGGSLVVNGVLASCYTSTIPPSVAHMLLFPIRVIYRVLPSSWFKAMIKYDKALGKPTWLVKYRKYFLK